MKPRYFRRIGGFKDGTEYIKCVDRKYSYIKGRGRYRNPRKFNIKTFHYPLHICIEKTKGYNKYGQWEELKIPPYILIYKSIINNIKVLRLMFNI